MCNARRVTNVADAPRRAGGATRESLYLLTVASIIEAARRSGSPRVVDACAHGLARLAYRVSRRKRRHMERNLMHVFHALSTAERDRIVRGAFYTFWDETLSFVPWRAAAAPDLEVVGLDHLEAALAAGHGAVLWESGFFGRRNLAKQALARRGFLVHQVHDVRHRGGFAATDPTAVPVPSRARAYFDAREREFTAAVIQLHRPEPLAAVREIVAVLARNAIVAITADVAQGHRLLRFPLLGVPKAFPTGMVNVARSGGAALLPLFCVRERDGRVRVIVEPALPAPARDDRDGVGATLGRYAALLDAYLRRYPDQYRSWHFPWWTPQ